MTAAASPKIKNVKFLDTSNILLFYFPCCRENSLLPYFFEKYVNFTYFNKIKLGSVLIKTKEKK
ncbi:MAG: hypothetical protein COA81_00195 [Alphaproteobacteria bacterium]|nr:MAG: hypothetical protein COA81_00195 [Alphaproteobacteria bacterium]